MAQRLHRDRQTITLAVGLTIEVQPVGSDTVYRAAVALAAAYYAPGAVVSDVIERLVGLLCIEAQPTWDIIDHRGVIPPTPNGMLRLPDAMILEVATRWAEEWVAEPPQTAVDKMVPPGEMRDELNRRLRLVKAA